MTTTMATTKTKKKEAKKIFLLVLKYFKCKGGGACLKKYQDVDDDDLHFMQKALLIRRLEASTPALHRYVIIIIIIITVTMMPKCFPCRGSAENSEALSHVGTSLLSFLNECKNFRTFDTPRFFFFFFVFFSCHILFVSLCFSGRGVVGLVADTADKKLQRGMKTEVSCLFGRGWRRSAR